MIELRATDILSLDVLSEADAVCFTSNGVIKSGGRLVMGAGVARQFRDRFAGLDVLAGRAVQENGNRVQIIEERDGVCILNFPTKHHWRSKSDIGLIKESAADLMWYVDEHDWSRVFLPYPGIGKGGLSKDKVVRAIDDVLDDRVFVCLR